MNGRRGSCSRAVNSGFTLIEVVVTAMLVAIAVVASLGGIRAMQVADGKSRAADLLQRLAAEKMEDVVNTEDPSNSATSGDFADRGYPDITWSLEFQPSSATNVDEVTLTATQGKDSQAIIQYLYVQPAATSTGTTTTGAGQ